MKQAYRNDDEALKELALGNERAFYYLFEKYFFWIGRIGIRYLQDINLSQDLVQDIFSTVWARRADFKGVEHFQSYLYTMTRNLALQSLKKLAKEQVARREFASRKAAHENNIEQYLNEKEYSELISEAVEKLRPQQRQIFEMAKNQGLSHSAIAKQLELSQQTVSNQMTLALKFIKGHMKENTISLLVAAWFFS
jgi:RNA polymerase sigma-70 factor (family 1)